MLKQNTFTIKFLKTTFTTISQHSASLIYDILTTATLTILWKKGITKLDVSDQIPIFS